MNYKITKPVTENELETVIPKGYRLIKDWELLKLSHENKEIKDILINDYLWCESLEQAVVLGVVGDVWFNIIASGSINSGRPVRGVVVKIDEVKE